MTLPVVIQIVPALGDGGVERSAVEMASVLKKAGNDTIVVSSGGKMEAELAALGVPHVRLPLARKNPLLLPWNIGWLAWLLWRNPRAIIHARSRWPAWCAWLANRILPLAKRGFFITTYHGTYGSGSRLKRWYNGVMLRGVVIANSCFIRDHLVAVYGVPHDSIFVAPRGVDEAMFDPDRITPAARSKAEALWGNAHGARLLCVGRLTRWKGQDVLLRALATLTDLPWTLVLAGDAKDGDTYKAELATLIHDLGLDGRVVMAGSQTDMAALNLVADLAISPSVRPEAFGRVAVEAMAMGTPVVATALGGSTETIMDGKTGWLVPVPPAGTQENGAALPHALAQSIRHALTLPTPALQKVGIAARAHVLGKFTTSRTCAAEMAAYELATATRHQQKKGKL